MRKISLNQRLGKYRCHQRGLRGCFHRPWHTLDNIKVFKATDERQGTIMEDIFDMSQKISIIHKNSGDGAVLVC